LSSKLKHEEAMDSNHKGILQLYKDLLHLRKTHPALMFSDRKLFEVLEIGNECLAIIRHSILTKGPVLIAVVYLKGSGTVLLHSIPEIANVLQNCKHPTHPSKLELLFTTEDDSYKVDSTPK